jgi:hypothetical protein
MCRQYYKYFEMKIEKSENPKTMMRFHAQRPLSCAAPVTIHNKMSHSNCKTCSFSTLPCRMPCDDPYGIRHCLVESYEKNLAVCKKESKDLLQLGVFLMSYAELQGAKSAQSKNAKCNHASFATTKLTGKVRRRRCDTEVGDGMNDGDVKSTMDESPLCVSSMVGRSDIQELALSRRCADPIRRACDGLDAAFSKACLRARSSSSHLEIDGFFILCCRAILSDLLVALFFLISDRDFEVRSMLRRD